MADRQIVVDIFDEVIDATRETGTIIGSSEYETGKYELTTENEITFERKVVIDGTEYDILNVTPTSFEIEAETGQDFTGLTWKANESYYLYGHPLDVANVLLQKDGEEAFIYKKYPLIVLLQDFEEDHRQGFDLEMVLPRLRVLILTETIHDYNSKQRYEKTFKPILYPIYNRLLKAMSRNPDLRTSEPEQIGHRKWDRLYWGREGIMFNDKILFNDLLDGIELEFVDLEVLSRDECNDN